jgi:uncharacterized membrane protein YcaP (DUF421 family)
MQWDLIWKAALVVVVGTLLLRVAGRKSISQMTLAQTVIMIAIGSLLIQPVTGKSVWVTFAVAGTLVATLIVLEFFQVKFDPFEKFITGRSKILIENGTLNLKNLSKLRLTVDQLEMQLRQAGVSKISDVKWATLEPNGQLGYLLQENAQPATKGDIQNIINLINTKLPTTLLVHQSAQFYNPSIPSEQPSQSAQNLFSEIPNQSKKNPPAPKLQ